MTAVSFSAATPAVARQRKKKLAEKMDLVKVLGTRNRRVSLILAPFISYEMLVRLEERGRQRLLQPLSLSWTRDGVPSA